MTKPSQPEIGAAFEDQMVEIPIDRIIPLKQMTQSMKSGPKFELIASTVEKKGLVEPPVVFRCKDESGRFLLLDGHARIEVLKSLGETSVVCLIATDDEAFTYNKRLCRLATIQEHKMILKLAEHGMSEQSIAELMRVDVSTLRTKLRLLDGISPEVAELLKDKRCPVASIRLLRQMKPARQLHVASLMVQMGTYTSRFVTTMLETSRPADRIAVKNTRAPKLTPEQVEQMQAEMAGLQERIKEIEGSYGTENLKLVLGVGYITALLQNARVTRFLSQRHKEIYAQFERIAKAAAA
ncbi:plasmid partitioning protein RepB C-terminal domain-containing protein [Paracoccus sp. AS002]|uniref:plasmid partitioning protein RepB C-terminal domain-containing protein n=1 Tax=Paracoccus sp. AS002 TaxID=3019545 RepID=UPI0023E8582E|nr:plasmid partitioning protein RepB C-terminal domain-containing protein [Paracoccus sp. AS002]MDF3907284.1 plasmid partitioning protein RepB C-terminal domain-containing protein [Paracoccus sp. AS002]